MPRRWSSFHPETTNREFEALPYEDRKALFEAMKAYRMELGTGHAVDSYGGGLLRIKPGTGRRAAASSSPKRSGRV